MIANKYKIGSGIGKSKSPLVSFDKALINAGVGNYNLVRLSSILPAGCSEASKIDLPEGSLLPTAYSTVSSKTKGETIVSTIGVGLPVDKSKVGVIMEYSAKNVSEADAIKTLHCMIQEAFESRGWKLDKIVDTSVLEYVAEDDTEYTTFACIAEW